MLLYPYGEPCDSLQTYFKLTICVALQTPRVVTAGSALLQKVNVYECLASLQQTVDRSDSQLIAK